MPKILPRDNFLRQACPNGPTKERPFVHYRHDTVLPPINRQKPDKPEKPLPVFEDPQNLLIQYSGSKDEKDNLLKPGARIFVLNRFKGITNAPIPLSNLRLVPRA